MTGNSNRRHFANEKLKVRHPTKEHIASIELTEIYEKPEPSQPFSLSVAIFGRGQLDRCPCGTGTSATMAALFRGGELPLGVEFINESIAGTRFTGKLLSETRMGDFAAANPLVAGRAFITGIQQFVMAPDDPPSQAWLCPWPIAHLFDVFEGRL